MSKLPCIWVLFAAAALTASLASGAGLSRKFDFQPAGAALMPGFTAVTPETVYSAESGFGFAGSPKTIGETREKLPDPLLEDALSCDVSFRVDLPNGEWAGRVYLRSFGQRWLARSYQVWVNGTAVAEEQVTAERFFGSYFFANEFIEARPGDSVWHKYVEPRTLAVDFRATVPNGKLELRVAGENVSGLLLWPTEREAEARREIAALDEQRRAYFEKHFWRERQAIERGPALELTDEDLWRGYVLFTRPWAEKVYPHSVPRPWERAAELRAAAAPGELEPLVFSLRPLRDLRAVDVSFSGLDRLPQAEADLRTVKFTERMPRPGQIEWFDIIPNILVHRNPVAAERGLNRTWWLTIGVPANAQPGVYEGHFTVRVDDQPPVRLPVKLRVLPMRLETPPSKEWRTGAYGPAIFLQKGQPDEFWARAETELREMLAHGHVENGYYSAWLPAPKLRVENDRVADVDLRQTERMAAIYRKAGMPVPPLTLRFDSLCLAAGMIGRPVPVGNGLRSYEHITGFEARFRQAATVLRDAADKIGLQLQISIPDEPNRALEMELAQARLIRSVPGIRATSSGMRYSEAVKFGTLLDEWGCYLTNTKLIGDAAAKAGVRAMADHGSAWRDPAKTRFQNGLWFMRSRFSVIRWWYRVELGDPYVVLEDAGKWESNFVFTSRERTPNPTLDWEAAREGVDDARYLYTLQRMIEAARKSRNETARIAADQAEQDVSHLLGALDEEWNFYQQGPGTIPTADALDNIRAELVTHSLRLADALQGRWQPAADATAPWADKKFPRRVLLRAQSGLWSHDDALVRWELPKSAGGVRMFESSRGGPSRSVAVAILDGSHLVWRLAGHTPGWSERCYWLYLGGPATAHSDPQLLDAAHKFFAGENLLANPGFEQAAGWEFQAAQTNAVRIVQSESHSGRACARLEGSGKNVAPAVWQRVRVRPGTEYLLGVWSRVLAAPVQRGLPAVARVNWQDAEGRNLGRDWVVRGDYEPGWHFIAGRFTSPPQAAFAMVTFVPAEAFAGTVLYDDSIFCPYNRDYFLPVNVYAGPVETKK
jgi:hypothetical protein